MSQKARSGKMKARHLMRNVWAKQLALKTRTQAASKHNIQDHERRESPPIPTDRSSHRADASQQPSRLVGDGTGHSDAAEKLAEAIPSASGTTSSANPSLAPVTSSTTPFLLPLPVNPWKKAHEELRIMKLGEPGRLAFLASTYSCAEYRSRLTKPGEPEMTWEEVKAAVRESPPLKRKFNSDVDDDTEKSPRPAKMSRFEERTARVNVYDFPKNPFTTYHPTKPRRKRSLPMDGEEELHYRKKRCCDGLASIFEPRGRLFTGDSILQILRPIKVPPVDAAKSDESPHQEPKEAACSVPVNCQMPSVVPMPEVENSLRPVQAVASKISVPIIKESTPPSVPKVQFQAAAERSQPIPIVTNATEPASQPIADGSKVSSIPKSPLPSSSTAARAKNFNKEGDLTRLFFKSTQNSRDRALGYLGFARNRAIISKDQRLVSKMTESQRLSLEPDLIKPTGTRPQPRPSSLHNDDDNDSSKNKKVDEKKVSSSPPPDCMGDQINQQPSHNNTVDVEKKKKNLQSRKEARRRAGFWTSEMEMIQAQSGGWIKEEREALIKMRKRILRALPGKKSPLRVSISESESESGP